MPCEGLLDRFRIVGLIGILSIPAPRRGRGARFIEKTRHKVWLAPPLPDPKKNCNRPRLGL